MVKSGALPLLSSWVLGTVQGNSKGNSVVNMEVEGDSRGGRKVNVEAEGDSRWRLAESNSKGNATMGA